VSELEQQAHQLWEVAQKRKTKFGTVRFTLNSGKSEGGHLDQLRVVCAGPKMAPEGVDTPCVSREITNIKDIGRGKYRVEFKAPTLGLYTIRVWVFGQEVPISPFSFVMRKHRPCWLKAGDDPKKLIEVQSAKLFSKSGTSSMRDRRKRRKQLAKALEAWSKTDKDQTQRDDRRKALEASKKEAIAEFKRSYAERALDLLNKSKDARKRIAALSRRREQAMLARFVPIVLIGHKFRRLHSGGMLGRTLTMKDVWLRVVPDENYTKEAKRTITDFVITSGYVELSTGGGTGSGNNKKERINVNTVSGVVAGCTCFGGNNSNSSKIDMDLCYSITTKDPNRSIDLECHTQIERDYWIKALNMLFGLKRFLSGADLLRHLQWGDAALAAQGGNPAQLALMNNINTAIGNPGGGVVGVGGDQNTGVGVIEDATKLLDTSSPAPPGSPALPSSVSLASLAAMSGSSAASDGGIGSGGIGTPRESWPTSPSSAISIGVGGIGSPIVLPSAAGSVSGNGNALINQNGNGLVFVDPVGAMGSNMNGDDVIHQNGDENIGDHDAHAAAEWKRKVLHSSELGDLPAIREVSVSRSESSIHSKSRQSLHRSNSNSNVTATSSLIITSTGQASSQSQGQSSTNNNPNAERSTPPSAISEGDNESSSSLSSSISPSKSPLQVLSSSPSSPQHNNGD